MFTREQIKRKEERLYSYFGYKVIAFADANDAKQMTDDIYAYEEVVHALEQASRYQTLGYKLN